MAIPPSEDPGLDTPLLQPNWRERRGGKRRGRGWLGLGLFWACIATVLAVGGATLQVLGPPRAGLAPHAAVSPPAALPAVAVAPDRTPTPSVAPSGSPAASGSPTPPGSIAAPESALLEPVPGDASALGLPRIAADGRAPMRVYAARFDPTTKVPRIAVLIAGIGLNEAASEDAIHTLPAAVTLAVSPYATRPGAVAAAARQAGHEYLASIPLEPQGYALNDPGDLALLTSASPADNARLLNRVLSRLAGYVGATGALGDMRGERFAQVADQMDPMLATLAMRGLLYVDPRPGAARLPYVWSRTIDVVIDDPPTAASIDTRLADLEKRAHDTGVALGLIGAIRPVTMEHLVAWVGNLGGRGYVLAPISAIVTAPEVKLPK